MKLREVLAPFDMSEDEFVEELSRELRTGPSSAASRVTVTEAAMLQARGGITVPLAENRTLPQATLRSASANLAEQTRESLSVQQAAELLHVDGSRVRHRVRDKALHAFKIGGALRLPSWQFDRGDAIPGLRTLLAVLPVDLHPLEVAGFMTTPDADLAVQDEPSSPRDWLVGGGEVQAIVELIEHLDAW